MTFRTTVYIDGYNLYNGVRRMYKSPDTPYEADRWREVLWLDLVKLSESFLNPTQALTIVKYFTARITSPKSKMDRQSDYLDAVSSLPKNQIIEGKYHDNNLVICQHCGKTFFVSKEKQTDVNLTTELLVDAIEDKFDSAYLVTADSDYKAPLKYIKNKYPQKRVYMEFVETNFSNILARLTYRTYIIKRDRLVACQLPDTVTMPSGYKISRPAKWK
ncbi:MAG: NYN domain-containing protein [Chloroflexi bacterium]|nr:NYN domain-containing protein [Chloroflexota bacterium]